jgi:transposase InsO family protein
LSSFDFGFNKSGSHACHSCQLGKHVRLPFASSDSRTYFPFQIVHADVWTSPVISFSSYKYYLVLLHDFTHYIWTFPLRLKSDVLAIIRSFHAYVYTQFRLPLVALQTDNGKEFDSAAMRAFLSSNVIDFRLSCPYTSQHNCKAERVLRTINDCVRTLLIHSAAPTAFWVEALSIATFLINRRPCTSTDVTTPFQLLLGCSPDYSLLRVFGSLCYPNLNSTTANKLCPRFTLCVFIGYPAATVATAATTSTPGESSPPDMSRSTR